jgi:hypothetical protein
MLAPSLRRSLFSLPSLCSAMLLVLCPTAASAFPAASRYVDTRIEARITAISDPNSVLHNLQNGSTVFGRFSFDPDVVGQNPSTSQADWTAFNQGDPGVSLIELFAFLGEDLLYRSSVIPEREAVNDPVSGDLVRFSVCQMQGVPFSFCLSAELSDVSGFALSSAEWPASIDLAQWPSRTLSLFSPLPTVGDDRQGANFSVTAEIISWQAELRTIPEPSTLGLLISFLALLGPFVYRPRH